METWPFLNCHLDAFSNFYQIVGTRQPSSRVRDLEPTSYKSGQPLAGSPSCFLPGRLPELIFQGVFILLMEMTSPSSGALWPF